MAHRARSRVHVMDRRRFLCGVTLWTLTGQLAAEAQQPGKVPRVGYLSMLSRSDPTIRPLRNAFQEGLREHGYIEGQTIIIEWRFADGSRERLPGLAAELVRLKVDLIVAETTPAARAATQATTTIPIVFNPIADPVGEGFVANLARPGGNATRLTQQSPELSGKRLELAHSGVPSERAVRVMLEQTETAARALGVQLRRLEVQDPRDLDRPFAAMSRERSALSSCCRAQCSLVSDGSSWSSRPRTGCQRCSP